MDAQEQLKRWGEVSRAFSPGAPIDKYKLFAGRTEQVRDVVMAVHQRGQHVILFGERGVGKTSLANVLSELLAQAGYRNMDSGTINCDGTDSFSSLWHKICREMSIAHRLHKPGFTSQPAETHQSLESLLPEKVTPDDVRYILQHLETSTIIIDELDRMKAGETTTLLADTIKSLSDHSVNTTLILVGIADSVDDLIAEHHSIERSLVQVHMPRMSRTELFEILDKGLAEVRMTIQDDAKERLAELSQGLPHYTHLLGLHAAQTALSENREQITRSDVEAAIRIAVAKAQQSIRNAYHKATHSPRQGTLYARVLLACALAPTDELGYFAATDVRPPMSRIMGKPYEIPAFSRHLNDFCDETRGPILQKKGTRRRFRFRFVNPLMQPFVIMHGLANALLPRNMSPQAGALAR